MSDKSKCNSCEAKCHLRKLSQIITKSMPKDMELMDEKNKYQESSLNYKELEEKYNDLSLNYSKLEQKI
jgi:hypothetical protein